MKLKNGHIRGHHFRHRRLRWTTQTGLHRGFYARWRSKLQVWECCISGASMKPRRWFSPTQESALSYVRIVTGQWGGAWRAIFSSDMYQPWDNGLETRYAPPARNVQLQIPFFLQSQPDTQSAVSA